MPVAIVGDFDPLMHTHVPLVPELAACGVSAKWVATRGLDVEGLRAFDGVVLAPGSPYADFARVLAAIRLARTEGIPFLGICGGFQHVLIEFAVNVLGWADADSAEHGRASAHLVIVPAPCRLDGRYSVSVLPGTRLASIYGEVTEAHETYFCGYEADPAYEPRFAEAGLRINARATDGLPRGCELAEHPFFVATAFQPQMRAGHPVLAAFAQAGRLRPSLR